MRYLLPLLCLIFACGGSVENKNTCGKIRTGQFQVMTPPGGQNWTIFRKDSVQEEINIHTSETVTYSVKWTGPCEYELRYLFTSPVDTTHDLAARRQEVLTVSVGNVTDNSYEYTMKRSTGGSAISGMIKIMREGH